MGRQATPYEVGRLVEEAEFTIVIEYDASNNPVYVGKAEPGSATSEAKWQVKKITYDASNNPTNVQFAEGRADYVFVWGKRATYSYS